MKTVTGDIWDVSTPEDVIVIPTNVGWGRDGQGILGAGLAREAAEKFPGLRAGWGVECKRRGVCTGPLFYKVHSPWCSELLLFPTKPLDVERPWLSWKQAASLELIEEGLAWLCVRDCYPDGCEERRILLPSLGCGHGGLSEPVVVPLMEHYLIRDRYVHVRRP